ncbi:MAG: hypothetical protein Kow00129_08480 [Thermoleophilia bacterium]
MLFAVSTGLGFALALVYHRFVVRSQLWLSHHSSKALPVLSVGSLFLRLTLLGILILLLHAFTQVNVVVTAVAFAGLFTVLSLVSLYRLTADWGSRHETSAGARN